MLPSSIAREHFGALAAAFVGDSTALKWAVRDLEQLHQAVELCPQRRSVVQAGGHCGVFAGYLSMCFEAVYTFEPDSTLFSNLCHNVRAKHVYRLQAALGDTH